MVRMSMHAVQAVERRCISRPRGTLVQKRSHYLLTVEQICWPWITTAKSRWISPSITGRIASWSGFQHRFEPNVGHLLHLSPVLTELLNSLLNKGDRHLVTHRIRGVFGGSAGASPRFSAGF